MRFSADGSIQAISYERQVDAPTARLLESILRDTQVRVPACWDEEHEWRATENLVTANVLSHYRWNDEAREVRWTRERVLLWKDAEGLFPLRTRSAEITGSGHMARLSEDGTVQEPTGRDEFILARATGKLGDMRLRTSIELKPACVTRVASQARSMGRHLFGSCSRLRHPVQRGGAEVRRLFGRPTLDVGRILHVGTRMPRLMVVTAETCQGPRACAGLAFAYGERITDNWQRLNDDEWEQMTYSEFPDVAWMSGVLAE